MKDDSKDNPGLPQSADEMAELMLSPFIQCMEAHGISETYLVKKLKKELNAKEKKSIKVRGAVGKKQLGKGRVVVVTSGSLAYNKEGEQLFGDGDTVIEWDDVAWTVRQRARQDAHKLRGDYPAERMEHLGKDGQPLKLIDKVVFEIVQPEPKDDDA